MKQIVSIAIFILLFAGQSTAQYRGSSTSDLIFRTYTHQFGRLDYGEKADFDYVFKNTGKDTIIITNVKAKCGCTPVEWPKNPIYPGDKGKITIQYDTSIYGNFQKSIYVFTNEGSQGIKLSVSGNVLKPEPGSKYYELYKKKYNNKILKLCQRYH
jgi:hypothetical protein